MIFDLSKSKCNYLLLTSTDDITKYTFNIINLFHKGLFFISISNYLTNILPLFLLEFYR